MPRVNLISVAGENVCRQESSTLYCGTPSSVRVRPLAEQSSGLFWRFRFTQTGDKRLLAQALGKLAQRVQMRTFIHAA
jgi:hypothetical protein